MSTAANAVASTGARELFRGISLWNPDKKPAVANKLVNNQLIKDTRSFLKIATFTGPGLPQAMEEFDAFPEDQYAELDNATFTCDKWGLKLRFSREVWKDNQFPELMRNYGTDLRKRFFDRREILVTNKHFNNADTNLAPNGEAFADAAIPLDDEAAEILGEATYSNLLDPAETASPDMADRMAQMLMYEPDNKGILNGHMPPFDIFTAPKWFGTWTQIKKSTESFDPAQQSPGYNYAATLIRNIIPLGYATHLDRTLMQATGDREQHSFIWDREEFDLNPLRYDDDNDSMVASAVSRLVTDEFHQRGRVYSLAGS